jgi:hypothetical protein
MARNPKLRLKLPLEASESASGWQYITVPHEAGERFPRNGGSRRVICTINGAETFPCALMPYEGAFTIVINKARRKALAITPGDILDVEITADDSKYGMPMPEELDEVLNQDPDGRKLFDALKPGQRRSMMYYIGKLKDIDRRIHCALILIDHIKRNDGKIEQKGLYKELQRPVI